MSIKSYQRAQQSSESSRSTEYRAMAMITSKLMDGRDKARSTKDRKALIEACFLNQKLWTIFAADLAMPDNRLPDETKASLISLSIWVQKTTPKVMRGEVDADTLIDVNRSIMEGLSTNPAAVQAAPRPVASPVSEPIASTV